MVRIAESITDLIGKTPLLRLNRVAGSFSGELLAKLEMLNPGGSEKDRVAEVILDEAEASGKLAAGTVIIEPTSGNIAFSLAMVAVPRGYHLVIVMPDGVPAWRVRLLRAMGAEVVLSPAAYGMHGAAVRAETLANEYEQVFRPNQFSNPANPAAHRQTADEIWEDCDGQVAAVVAGVGTGGTVTGIGRRLKELGKGDVHVVAVEPAASAVLSGGKPLAHSIHGMGPSFVPENYDPTVVDEVIAIPDNECHDTLLHLYRQEGLVSGPTGGAAVAAALRLARRETFAGERIVAIVPDGMERYADTNYWEKFRVVLPTVTENR